MENNVQIDIEMLNEIYQHLGDEKSKEMFKNRLMFSITKDEKWIIENLKIMEEGKFFISQLEKCSQNGEMVIFGVGVRGKILYQMYKNYPWKFWIDNHSNISEFEGIPILRTTKFLEKYHGEYIFVTPKNNNEEILEQLRQAGVPDTKIINVGKIQNELMKNQYFDLKYLKHSRKKEVFVDVGGYDGMTSVYFNKWSQKECFSYIFEPDKDNIKKCQKNLKKYNINYKIIQKGAWNEEMILNFNANGDVSSQISNAGGDMITVSTIDKELRKEEVSFIKMDIEGAELQALKGAKNTIINNKPQLAISVYHKPEDIWEIPNIILKYNSDYKLYLRHYTFTDADTVLYALL